MTTSNKLLAQSILLLAALCGTVSIAMFALAPTGSLRIFRTEWPLAGVLAWDALLSLAFFVQHSGMVRRSFRAWLGRFVPLRYHAAIYAIASGVVLAAVVVFWQPSGPRLLVLDGLPRRLAEAISIAAIGLFFWGGFTLRSFDPFGLSPIRDYLKGRREHPPVFVVRGPYRWVRHPLYFCILLFFWTTPEVTPDRLLFNILWTAWIWIGTELEEIDLTVEFGDAYREYRRTVPMLFPWRIGMTPRQGATVGSQAQRGTPRARG